MIEVLIGKTKQEDGERVCEILMRAALAAKIMINEGVEVVKIEFDWPYVFCAQPEEMRVKFRTKGDDVAAFKYISEQYKSFNAVIKYLADID